MSLQSGQSDSLIWWLNRLISTPCVFLPLHGCTPGKWGHRDNTSFLSAAKLVQCLCLGKERMLCFGTRICFLSFRLHYSVSVDNAGPQWSNCAASPREKWSALSTTPLPHLEAGKRAQKHQCPRPQPSYPSPKREDPQQAAAYQRVFSEGAAGWGKNSITSVTCQITDGNREEDSRNGEMSDHYQTSQWCRIYHWQLVLLNKTIIFAQCGRRVIYPVHYMPFCDSFFNGLRSLL